MRGRALDGSVSRGGERENFGLNDPSGYMWFMHQAANLFGHVGPKAGSPTAVTDLRRNAFDDKQLVFDRVYPVHLPGGGKYQGRRPHKSWFGFFSSTFNNPAMPAPGTVSNRGDGIIPHRHNS